MRSSRGLLPSSFAADWRAHLAGLFRAPADVDWVSHGGDRAHASSPLDQITPANVASLKVAWTYHGGDARPDRSQISAIRSSCTASSTRRPRAQGVRLDAATGARKWIFDPPRRRRVSSLGVNRGSCSGRTAPSSESSSHSDSASTRSTPDRRVHPGLRHQRQRRLEGRAGPRRLEPVCALEHTGRDLQGPADPRHARL